MSGTYRWSAPADANTHWRPLLPSYVWGILIGRNNPTCSSWQDALWANNPSAREPDLNPRWTDENVPF